MTLFVMGWQLTGPQRYSIRHVAARLRLWISPSNGVCARASRHHSSRLATPFLVSYGMRLTAKKASLTPITQVWSLPTSSDHHLPTVFAGDQSLHRARRGSEGER